MVSRYEDAEEGRPSDPREHGVSGRSEDDLERRTIGAVRLHRELLRNAEYHHGRWRDGAELPSDMEELAELREVYGRALRQAQAQQIALSMLVDQLGRIPRLPEDDDLPDGEVGRTSD